MLHLCQKGKGEKNTTKSSKKLIPKHSKNNLQCHGASLSCVFQSSSTFFSSVCQIYFKKCYLNKTRQWMQDLISSSQVSQFHLPFLFFCQRFHLLFQYIRIFYQKQECIPIIIPRMASLYTRFLKLPLINLLGVNMFLKQPFLV